MAISVIGFGAGGHAKCLIEILRGDDGFHVVGLLDSNRALAGQAVLGIPVLGSDDLIAELKTKGVTHFFLGLGGAGDNGPRRRLYESAIAAGLQPVNTIHPRATVSGFAKVGSGLTALAHAVINPGAKLGDNVIVNSGAIVEHDCVIGDHVHLATGARLASTVRVGTAAHVGAGATVRQCITIGDGAVIGAGAVVVKDVPPGVTVVGVPARVMR